MKTHLGVAFILLAALFMAVEGGGVDDALNPCSLDYFALCTCSHVEENQLQDLTTTSTNDLTCQVSTQQDVDAIQRKSSYSSTSNIYFQTVTLVMAATLKLPEDVLGAMKTDVLSLSCSDRSMPLGPVHSDAFRSTGNHTKTLFIQDCDLTETSFAFLSQFPVMDFLGIKSCSIKEILEMPYLPQLTRIFFEGPTTNFEKWYDSSQTPHLEFIWMSDMPDLDDAKMDSILSSMTENFVYPQLRTLWIYRNKLTRIPPLASIFPDLVFLNLYGNPIQTLASGSVQKGFTKLTLLDLYETGLTTIEPGAFVGDFPWTRFDLHNNQMTNFPSSVFKDLLKSMLNQDRGSVDISENPIVFDCDLKWLLVDNRDFLPYVRGGAIANGTLFTDLDPQELINC